MPSLRLVVNLGMIVINRRESEKGRDRHPNPTYVYHYLLMSTIGTLHT